MEAKFSISRENILSVVKRAGAAAARNSNFPILSTLRITAEGTQMAFVGSDMQSQVTVTTSVNELKEPFSICINAKKLSDIVSSLEADSEINFHIKDKNATVRAGKSRFTLQALSAEDYPFIDFKETEKTVSFEMKQGVLRSMLARVEHASGKNDPRHYLNGVHLTTEADEIHVVATNGHRLATTSFQTEISNKVSIIMPNKTVSELMKSLSDSTEQTVAISIESNLAVFNMGNVQIISKLIDAKYPDWLRVVPPTGQTIVKLPVEDVKAALSRSRIVLDDKNRGIRIKFANNVMSFEAINTALEELGEELDVEMTGEGFTGGWNVDYLNEIICAANIDEITVSQGQNDGPMLFEAPAAYNFRGVVMAMRL